MTKVLAAQVARAARSWATSQLARRVRRVRPQNTVSRPTRNCSEGFSRSWLHLRRIFIDATPWLEQGCGRPVSRAHMSEWSRSVEGVERMDCGTLSCRVRRENPDLTSPPTKKRSRQILSHFHRQLEMRVPSAEATSFVRETRQDRHDLKGRPSHVTVRLRVLVQKYKPASRHWRLATCYYD